MRFHLKILVFVLLLASFASAQPQPNIFTGGDRWLVTAFDDSAPNHSEIATHVLCFFQSSPGGVVGTHVRGVWFSTSFPNWRGRFSQEGDRVVLHGEFGDRVGHDAGVFDLYAGTSPNDEAAGDWVEWFESGNPDTSGVFASVRLRRSGSCIPPPGLTKMSGADLDKAVAELAAQVPKRMKTDGTAARWPFEAGQAPIK